MGKKKENGAAEGVEATENVELTQEQLSVLTQEELIQMLLDEKAKSAEAEAAFIEVIEELKAQVASNNKEVVAKPVVVELGKKVYSVAHPSFRYKGKIYKASELEQYPDVIKEIISSDDQTLLVEVEN